MIQSKCSVPFTPIEVRYGPSGCRRGQGAKGTGLHICCSCFFLQFHYENTRAQFFVEDASTASAIKAVNCKILDQDNRRVCIKGLAGGGDWYSGSQGFVLGLRLPWSPPFLYVFPADIYHHQLLSSAPYCTERTEARASRAAKGEAGSSHVFPPQS